MKFIYIAVYFLLSVALSATESSIPHLSVILTLSPSDTTINIVENVTVKLLDDYESYVVKDLKGTVNYKYDLIKGLSIDFSKSLVLYKYICDALNTDEIDVNNKQLVLRGLQALLIDFRNETLNKSKISLNVEMDQEVTILGEGGN